MKITLFPCMFGLSSLIRGYTNIIKVENKYFDRFKYITSESITRKILKKVTDKIWTYLHIIQIRD